jgi:hypothetical protein
MRVRDILPSRAITPTSGAWDGMDADMRTWLEGIAGNVRLLLGRMRADDAFDEWKSYHLEPEADTAFWTLLTSNERRVLKAVETARREKEKA